MSKMCLTCGNELPSDAKFCSICGTAMSNETSIDLDTPDEAPLPVICPNCGNPCAEDENFCRKCGTQMKERHETTTESSEANSGSEHADTSGTKTSNTDSTAPSSRAETESKPIYQKVVSVLSTIAAIAIALYFFVPHPIRDTKQIVFENYGTIELGDALEENLSDITWESEKIGKKRYQVTVSGFHLETGTYLSLTFNVNYAQGHVYAQAAYGYANGEYFDDIFSIAFVMGLIYS